MVRQPFSDTHRPSRVQTAIKIGLKVNATIREARICSAVGNPHERAILKRQPTMPELLVVSDCSLKEARGHTPVAGTSEASIIRAEGLQELNRAKENRTPAKLA
jgi:hypothetical protein